MEIDLDLDKLRELGKEMRNLGRRAEQEKIRLAFESLKTGFKALGYTNFTVERDGCDYTLVCERQNNGHIDRITVVCEDDAENSYVVSE